MRTIDYYIGLFYKIFLSYDINSIEDNNRNDIDRLIKKLSESNFLNLISQTQYENNVIDIIKQFFNIQKLFKYSMSSSQFHYIVNIIINLFIDKIINKDILFFIFEFLLIKDSNDFNYQLSYAILDKGKNTLYGTVSELIINTKVLKANDIQNEKYERLLKIISTISYEYLLQFFGKIKINNFQFNEKINGCSYLDILIKIFNTKNGLIYIVNYTDIYYNILNLLKSNINHKEKFRIFKSTLKMMSRNKFKNDNEKKIYDTIIDKLKLYLKNLKIQKYLISALKTANKLNKWKLINLVSTSLLNINNTSLSKDVIEYIFDEILIKKIFYKTICLDFNSIDKLKILNKVSEIFNKILDKVQDEKELMEFFLVNLNKTFNIRSKTKVDIEIDSDTNKDVENEISEYYNPVVMFTVYIFMTHEYNTNNLFSKILLFYYFPDSCPKSIDLPIIKEKQNKSLENDNNINTSQKSRSSIYEPKINLFSNLSFFSIETNYISELINFFQNYLLIVDEESNSNSIKLLNSLILTFMFFLKYQNQITKMKFLEGNDTISTLTLNDIEHKYISEIIKCIILPYLSKSLKDIDSCESIMSLLRELIMLSQYDVKIAQVISDLITVSFSNFILYDEVFPIKSFCKLFYDMSFVLYKINNQINNWNTQNNNQILNEIEYKILPANFLDNLFTTVELTNINYIKFINELFRNDFNNYYNEILFDDRIRNFITKQLPIEIEKNKTLRKNLLKQYPKSDKNFKSFRSLICIEHEIYKYKLYELSKNKEELTSLDCNYTAEVNDYLKQVLIKIYEYFQNDYIDAEYYLKRKDILLKKLQNFNKDNNNTEGENIDDDEIYEFNDSLLFKEDLNYDDIIQIKKEINKINRRLNKDNKCQPLLNLQLLNISKLINLIILFLENKVRISPLYQVQLSNIFLNKEIFIRENFLNRINKKLTKQGADLNYFYDIIPILMLNFNDKNKKISKLSQAIISSFIRYLYTKINEKDRRPNIGKNTNYKYIPEVYISYLLIYFIFNPNLNRLFQEGNRKYFIDTLTTFMKILKNECKGNIDSDFMLKLLSKIKSKNLKNNKIIQNINQSGIYLDLKLYDPIKDIDYEYVKNGVVELAQTLITSNFMNDFSYKSFIPEGGIELEVKMPSLFYGDPNEDYKSAIKIEDNDLSTNNRLFLLTPKLNLSKVHEMSKISYSKTKNGIDINLNSYDNIKSSSMNISSAKFFNNASQNVSVSIFDKLKDDTIDKISFDNNDQIDSKFADRGSLTNKRISLNKQGEFSFDKGNHNDSKGKENLEGVICTDRIDEDSESDK